MTGQQESDCGSSKERTKTKDDRKNGGLMWRTGTKEDGKKRKEKQRGGDGGRTGTNEKKNKGRNEKKKT